jgi:hypothetical protein
MSWGSNVINWFADNAESFVYGNLVWYIVLAVMFMAGGHYGKCVYFAGAAVLTVGIIMMR